ncbi:hypothetical protein ILYODFUR_003777 [Ilyodon furcidens]|uniref:Secreted protein n=1 Tax=Ilyodon furcidens TaxID=33524 RepID=A0ABV0T7B7_9TELE
MSATIRCLDLTSKFIFLCIGLMLQQRIDMAAALRIQKGNLTAAGTDPIWSRQVQGNCPSMSKNSILHNKAAITTGSYTNSAQTRLKTGLRPQTPAFNIKG